MYTHVVTWLEITATLTGILLLGNLFAYFYHASTKNHNILQPPTRLPQYGIFLGFDTFFDSLRAFHAHRLLSWGAKHFRDLNVKTLSVKMLGVSLIMTIEPKNLRTILPLDSAKWGLGERRKMSFKPLLGDGMAIP